MADPIAPPRALGDGEADRPAWWLLALPCSALFVFAAVVLEVAGGANANSPLPAWAHLVPLAWPQWARVLGWLGVAAAVWAAKIPPAPPPMTIRSGSFMVQEPSEG